MSEAKNAVQFSSEISTLRIRFLVDFFALEQRFRSEPGVSYLVTADRHQLLFDLGYNQGNDDPSPLRHNMRELELESIELRGILISHNHRDHMGGSKAAMERSPNLNQLPANMAARAKVFTPIEMRNPTAEVCRVPAATEILPGLASTGPLPAHLFFLGTVWEQSLLASVRDIGVILISGCGHPGIVEMVRIAKRITGKDVHAVVGGLHLIASRGRTMAQKYIAASHPPWAAQGEREVRQVVLQLRELGVKRLAPSAHDTCDVALGIMREVFADGYFEVRAGSELVFAARQ